MSRYYYDFHMHSCLSPCGDNDMTPNNIAGMGTLCGLQIMALTDHNTCKNCPAFFVACLRQGIVPVAGMELTTAEDIHLVCLFETLEQAMDTDSALQAHRSLIVNRPDIFGDQLIVNGDDEETGRETYLLPNATDLPLERAAAFIREHGGICYPAHIDRPSNGIIAVLGTFPDSPDFSCAEVHDPERFEAMRDEYPVLKDKILLSGSDAHYLWDIREKCCFLELDDRPYSSQRVRESLFSMLRAGGDRR